MAGNDRFAGGIDPWSRFTGVTRIAGTRGDASTRETSDPNSVIAGNPRSFYPPGFAQPSSSATANNVSLPSHVLGGGYPPVGGPSGSCLGSAGNLTSLSPMTPGAMNLSTAPSFSAGSPSQGSFGPSGFCMSPGHFPTGNPGVTNVTNVAASPTNAGNLGGLPQSSGGLQPDQQLGSASAGSGSVPSAAARVQQTSAGSMLQQLDSSALPPVSQPIHSAFEMLGKPSVTLPTPEVGNQETILRALLL